MFVRLSVCLSVYPAGLLLLNPIQGVRAVFYVSTRTRRRRARYTMNDSPVGGWGAFYQFTILLLEYDRYTGPIFIWAHSMEP